MQKLINKKLYGDKAQPVAACKVMANGPRPAHPQGWCETIEADLIPLPVSINEIYP